MHKNKLEFDFVNDLLIYNPENGKFVWKNSFSSRAIAGKEAGYKWTNSSGKSYWVIGINNNKVLAHNIAWLLFTKKWPLCVVDHLDGDGLNNRSNNLSDKSRSDNGKNQKLFSTNKLGIPGVYYSNSKNSYRVQIKSLGRCENLIHTKDFFEACCYRKSAERRLGFHENHGSIRPL